MKLFIVFLLLNIVILNYSYQRCKIVDKNIKFLKLIINETMLKSGDEFIYQELNSHIISIDSYQSISDEFFESLKKFENKESPQLKDLFDSYLLQLKNLSRIFLQFDINWMTKIKKKLDYLEFKKLDSLFVRINIKNMISIDILSAGFIKNRLLNNQNEMSIDDIMEKLYDIDRSKIML